MATRKCYITRVAQMLFLMDMLVYVLNGQRPTPGCCFQTPSSQVSTLPSAVRLYLRQEIKGPIDSDAGAPPTQWPLPVQSPLRHMLPHAGPSVSSEVTMLNKHEVKANDT